MTQSKRKYTAFILDGSIGIHSDICLRNITEPKTEDWEYIYALAEILDDVLDLPLLGVMYFQANRDDKDSKGVLVRIA